MNREAFERSYADAHDLPLETFSQYRMGDTYRLPAIASHYRTWCAALDSVVVELPERLFAGCPDPQGPDLNRVETIEAIEAAGLKVAP